MRKGLFIAIVVLFLVCLITKEDKKEIRVRIIPNSNSAIDINTKYEVKEVVNAYLLRVYDEEYDRCVDNIKNTLPMLNKTLNSMFDTVETSLDYHTLYNKTYNNNAVKNEECLCLYVVIGNGLGDNWWGTIYPNLLGISSSESVKYESLFLNLF